LARLISPSNENGLPSPNFREGTGSAEDLIPNAAKVAVAPAETMKVRRSIMKLIPAMTKAYPGRIDERQPKIIRIF
jgi:hypothetical protein